MRGTRKMNKLCGLLVAISGIAHGQSALSDIRIVNGSSVDVSPVHQWFLDKKGERPLKHWKQVQIVSMSGVMVGAERCLVKTEAGAPSEILIEHLPHDAGSHFKTLNVLLADIGKMTREIESDAREVSRTEIAGYSNLDIGDTVSVTASSNGGTTIDTTDERWRRFRALRAGLETKKAKLKSLLDRHDEELKRQINVLAMFTGRTYAKLAVWDCGLMK
jgi:hypothetical protein